MLWEDTLPQNNIESDAEIFVYLPNSSKNKKAVIICPGGSYIGLGINHEGHDFAKWLCLEGHVGIVLKFRSPKKQKDIPLEDIQRAMRIVRSKSEEWGIGKIGVAGFSSGGHLASTASTHFDSSETRPDFSILFYPVITMGENTHSDTKNNLLGDEPSENDILNYSNEKQVNENTPPAILLLSDNDKAVSPMNSIAYYNALHKNNIPASIHIFNEGGHGWGMKPSFKYRDEMMSLIKLWLNNLE